jgi:hypothetical protein
MEGSMATVVTVNSPEVVALIEVASKRFTHGNKTAVIKLALETLLNRNALANSLFGAHPGTVVAADGVDLTAPVLTDPLDAETETLALGARA